MFSYKEAGVDVEKADFLTNALKTAVKDENLGMFAGLCDHPYLPEYYFAACCDGVGTKIIPLLEYGLIETIANDLVAMNLNDLVCVGAKPVFFLDYIATPKLNVDLTYRFVLILKNILNTYNCCLLGGETSELGEMINKNVFDVAGFSVGLVKKDKVLKKNNVKEGDVLIGLVSNGAHSNGFTLIRKLFEKGLLTEDEFKSALSPTTIYVNELMALNDNNLINACANITGGGLFGNIERVMPDGLKASISIKGIPPQPIFAKLSKIVGQDEAFNTFNMGVGMCVVAQESNINEVLQVCGKYNPFILGKVVKE